MKKYLMMSLAAFAFVGAFTSCVSNDSETTEPKTQEDLYQAAFEQQFGAVNANQNWGFGADNSTVLKFDADGKLISGLTRGVNANGNEWGLYVNVPEPLTDAQKEVVTKWFKEHENPTGVAVNWSDFFVQQVYKGEWGGNMNYLYCGSDEDHTYNFNGGDAGVYDNVCYGLSDPNDQNARIYGSDKIEFMVQSSTEYFGFHNSFDSYFYKDNYVIIPGDWIDPIVAGMYFVGLDFEANGQADNQKVARDYYFDNWIVKITPGDYKVGQRVFVEDLIAKEISEDLTNIDGTDWDFNDAVYDVVFRWDNGKLQAVITVRAAGGTLPFYIGGQEVHELLGVPTYTTVNTIKDGQDLAVKGTTAPIAIFRLDVSSEDAASIPTSVRKDDGTTQQLQSKQGKATQKFAIPVTTKWVKETTLFTKAYPKFQDWVSDGTTEWWNQGVASELY